jgi:hypothetical protein
MDELTPAFALLGASLALLAASIAAGVELEIAPRVRSRLQRHRLAAQLAQLVAQHDEAPAPRRRHNAHCPACGRFARVTSSGPRGTWTRCAVHGVRLRAQRRIGRPETVLVAVSAYAPLLPEAAPPPTSPLWVELPRAA